MTEMTGAEYRLVRWTPAATISVMMPLGSRLFGMRNLNQCV